MRPKGSADLIANRRRRAIALLDKGLSLSEVARQVGSHPSSVMRWRDNVLREGEKAFEVRFSPGRPRRLTDRQMKRLISVLLTGAEAAGYGTDLWTTRRIAEVIDRKFGISYHHTQVGRLLLKMGWTHQKPERRAVERDEARIAAWKKRDWPRVKKTPSGWVPT
jgi:transposase